MKLQICKCIEGWSRRNFIFGRNGRVKCPIDIVLYMYAVCMLVAQNRSKVYKRLYSKPCMTFPLIHTLSHIEHFVLVSNTSDEHLGLHLKCYFSLSICWNESIYERDYLNYHMTLTYLNELSYATIWLWTVVQHNYNCTTQLYIL